MLTQAQIERSLLACEKDPSHGGQFLRDLLNARLYAFIPISDDSPNVRLVMFKTPRGTPFIPVFTSESQAMDALGTDRRVVEIPGRLLIETTLGATLILNPNREHCSIDPKDILPILGSLSRRATKTTT